MKKFAFLPLISGLCLNASAIVTNDNTIAAADPTGHGYSLGWGYVYRVNAGGGGSGAAVDPYWLLTAAHVANDQTPAKVTIGSSTYNAVQVVYHSSSGGNADLALMKFGSPIFAGGYYSLYTGGFPTTLPSAKLTGLMVGYGYAGNLPGDVQDSYYKWSSGANTKRWGTNKIDGTATAVTSDPPDTFTSSSIYMDFDLIGPGSTTYEAGGAVYDSGGPVFVQDGGQWKVAGVMINVARTRSGTPEGYYDRTIAVSVPAYADWIQSTIPEPGAASLVLVAGAMAAGWRRRQRLCARRRADPIQ